MDLWRVEPVEARGGYRAEVWKADTLFVVTPLHRTVHAAYAAGVDCLEAAHRQIAADCLRHFRRWHYCPALRVNELARDLRERVLARVDARDPLGIQRHKADHVGTLASPWGYFPTLESFAALRGAA